MVMNLQFFGGQGASFAKTKSAMDSFKKAGIKMLEDELKGMNPALVEKTLSGVRDTLNEFGLPLSVLSAVGETLGNKGTASMNGFGQLGLARKSLYIKRE